MLCEKDEQQMEVSENLLHGDISFNNVSYRINDVNILSNVSFTIPYKKKTAIVGKTGSGKSTIIKAVMGLLGEAQKAVCLWAGSGSRSPIGGHC